MRRIIPCLILLLATGTIPVPPSGAAVPDAAALARAYAEAPRGVVPVWVHFAPREVTAARLRAAAAGLDARTRARRGRVAGPTGSLVSAADLPLDAGRLQAARATGARLRQVSRWLNAASFDATAEQAAALAGLPGVRRVSPVGRGQRPPVTVTPVRLPATDKSAPAAALDYGLGADDLAQLNVPAVHALGLSGADVVVGLLDTGFRTTHEALRDIPVLAAWDFVNDDPVVDNEDGDLAGSRNHGTMTLSTLAAGRPGRLVGPAPGVAVILAKTEDVSQEVPAEEDHWVAGLEWVESLGADLVSSSLVYSDWYGFDDMDGNTAVTTRAAGMAAARGLIVVNSVGNDRQTLGHLAAPADGDSVISVGAVDADGYTAWFSSPGPTADGRIKPDVAALGVAVPIASPLGDRAYGTATGTSFSCPLISGVVALMLERAPALTPLQVREALRGSGDRAAAPDNDQGWGIVDALAAVTWFGPVWDHTPHPDSENTAGPYAVATGLGARAGVVPGSGQLVWRADGGPWQAVPLQATGGGPTSHFAEIPGQAAGTAVEYFLTATDLAGVTVTEPVRAPQRMHGFAVGPDTSAPVVDHVPLPNQTDYAWPPLVRCTATDNLGLATVELEFALNGGPLQGPYPLSAGADGAWTAAFPLPASVLLDGDFVTYSLRARDLAADPNETVDGVHAFTFGTVGEIALQLPSSGPVPVPDDDPQGGSSQIYVEPGVAGNVLEVAVGIDLTHASPEQLTISLTAPDGAVVTLHERGGAGTSDLFGTWPTTLPVSGPGSLDDLYGHPSGGLWTLSVVDHVAGDTGVVNGWNLLLSVTAELSAVGDPPAVADTVLRPNVPNPFNPSTRIAFRLAAAGETRLSIYDVRGMLVRKLLDGPLPAGEHALAWDGRDGRGRGVPSGLYLYRLETGATRLERKMTLIR